MTNHPVPHTFVVTVEDRPGVLNRVVSLVRRRGFNIESLTVGSTEKRGESRMTMVVRADADTARRVQANLLKLVDVLRVEDLTGAAAVVHELAFIRVRAPLEQRNDVLRICETFRGRVVDLSPTTLVVEVTGAQQRIDDLISALGPSRIVEMVRTGAVAMLRGGEVESDPQEVAA
jgi:acetolactate synthase-1/3 small subunit